MTKNRNNNRKQQSNNPKAEESSKDSKKADTKTETSVKKSSKDRLRTEGVTQLKYDRYSATSFVNFETDLRLVAGVEYGDLFGFVVEGKYPPEQLPNPRSLEADLETAVKEIEDSVLVLQTLPTPHSQEIIDKIAELQNEETMLQNTYNSMSAAMKTLLNLKLAEDYKVDLKEAASKKSKYRADTPKLYWLIRRNMSEESTDKIKEHMGATWEQSERNQDPVQLWSAIKTTHTAVNTGSKFFDQSTLKKGYHDMKMIQGETLVNLKTRMTTALRQWNQ